MKKLLSILLVLLSFSCTTMAQTTTIPQPGGAGSTSYTLTFQVQPSNAVVYVDGGRISGNSARVSPGQHTIAAQAAGYSDFTTTVNVQQNMTIPISMKSSSSGGSPSYTITFQVQPANAVIYIDGSRISGNSVRVSAGQHTVKAQASGYDDFSATVNVQQNMNYQISMKSSSSGTASYTLSLQVQPANAAVYIDGNRISGNSVRVAAGQHTVKIQASGYDDYTTTVNVQQNMNVQLTMKASSAGGTPVKPSQYTLTLQVQPSNAAVYIDGNRFTGNSIRLSGGQRTITAQAPGYEDFFAVINLQQNMTLPIIMNALAPANYRLTITANVQNPLIYVDGAKIQGNTATVSAGIHTVQVEAQGYQAYSAQVNISGNMTLPINLTLAQYQLTVTASNIRGAQVQIDGKAVGVTPLVTQLPPGVYTVTITAPGYIPYSERVTLNKPVDVYTALQIDKLATVTCILPPGSVLGERGNSRSRVDIYVDGISQTTNKFQVSAGMHTIRIESGLFSLEQTIQIEAGLNYTIQPGLLVTIQN